MPAQDNQNLFLPATIQVISATFPHLSPIFFLPTPQPDFCHSEDWASSVNTETKLLSKYFSLSAFDFAFGILMVTNKLYPSYVYSSEDIWIQENKLVIGYLEGVVKVTKTIFAMWWFFLQK